MRRLVMRHCILLASALIAAVLGFEAAAGAQPGAPAQQTQVTPLSADVLYQGWRASQVLGKKIIDKAGRNLGTVRNLIVGDDGQMQAFVVEGKGDRREFMFRVPWQKVSASELPARIVADVADSGKPDYGIASAAPGVAGRTSEFAASKVIGDYARLQAGQAYGYVSDLVFTRKGQLSAILVTRDAAVGGGTYAFGFPGSTGRWDARMSYYGLPYVTAEQADKAAVPVEFDRFHDSAS